MKHRRKLKIPASFRLLGHEITVEWKSKLTADDGESVYGLWIPDDNKIMLTEECRDKSVGEETFCHEVMEAINCILEMEYPHHEIQQLGAAWHQILTTMYTPRRKKCRG
jgi:hypothetical protein